MKSDSVLPRNVVLVVCTIVVMVALAWVLLAIFTQHNRQEPVPDFAGMTLAEAREAGRPGRLRVEVNDSVYYSQYAPGVILLQRPAAHTDVKSGRRVIVTVNASRPMMVRVPYVTGVSLRQAKNDLEVAGFEIGELVYRSDIATDYVLETRYDGRVITREGDVEAEQGSGVTLVVGMNDEQTTVIVPKVVGLPYAEARGRLWEHGLNAGKMEFDEGITTVNRSAAHAYRQSPVQGSLAGRGARVTVWFTLDDKAVASGSAASEQEARRLEALRQAEEQAAADSMQVDSVEVVNE
jgi:beta-lactam-binding protein with PASTA domain